MERRIGSLNVVDTLIEIGNERRSLLLKMRDAVRSKDVIETFRLAELLVGVEIEVYEMEGTTVRQ